jgi:putative tryptophan/tyrosine transport system substrate-binding protein
MQRRDFIALVGGAAAAWPLVARAQQKAGPVIGFLHSGSATPASSWVSAFRVGLSEAGLVEGQNVTVEYRRADNQNDRLPTLAAELVQRRVSVIVAVPNSAAVDAAKAATTAIPIVFMSAPDPVRTGLVASLSRPDGNLTGVTQLSADLTAKRLGLLHDVAPQVATFAILLDGTPGVHGSQEFSLKEAESAASSARARVTGVWVGNEADFDSAFATAVHNGAGALLVSTSQFFIDHREQLAGLSLEYKLPTIYQTREYPVAGGLMSYGSSFVDGFRQVGIYTGRILKGAKPADLPVLQPTKFEMVINLKTARALGLTVPNSLLAIADEVIE